MISMATTYITLVSQSVSDMIILSLAGRSDQQKHENYYNKNEMQKNKRKKKSRKNIVLKH